MKLPNRVTLLSNLKINALNEMQLKTIETIQIEKELILLSNTGSGKTLAFLIPLLETIDANLKNTIQTLILVPSRELAIQIDSVLKQLQTGYKISCCYGGHKREIEENNLVQPPAILIATAGRLADHIRRNNVNLSAVNFLVLDEFDKILELDFQQEMEFIFNSIPNITTKLLTSATQAIALPDYTKIINPFYLNFISNEPKDESVFYIKTVLSPENDKVDTLFRLLCNLKDTSSIVFCNHRDAVERTHQLLGEKDILSVFYHGGMEQHDREVALCKFRNGTSNVLITTDLASRGLDILNIRNVIHFHIPHTEDSFTHRNGRTARMDASGSVFVIIGPDEEIPAFLLNSNQQFNLPEKFEIPDKPKWSTMFIAAGKKDKINKIDIVGFLTQKGKLKKDEIGLIEVKDFSAFAAVRKSKIGFAIENVKNEKIKNKKVKIAVAK
jgi:superfamily II DNA/RNA helicase